MKKLILLSLITLGLMFPIITASTDEERQCRVECDKEYRLCVTECNQTTKAHSEDRKECLAGCKEDKTACHEDCSGGNDDSDEE